MLTWPPRPPGGWWMPVRTILEAARSLGMAAVVAAAAALAQATPNPVPIPPLAQAIPNPASPVISDYSVRVLAVGLAVVYVLSKAAEGAVGFKKSWRAADVGTAQAALEDCLEREKDCGGRCQRLRDELAHAYVQMGQKDQQITHDASTLKLLSDNNRALVDQLTALSLSLAAIQAERSRPVTVKIDPESEPVRVERVDEGKG